MDVVTWLEEHQSLSGWAQALGSLLTLWIGVHIAGSRQKTIAKAHALNARAIVRDAVEACAAISNTVRVNSARSQGGMERLLATLAAKQDALMQFPIHELPPNAIENFYQFRKSVREFARDATNVLSREFLPLDAADQVSVVHPYRYVFEDWGRVAKSIGIRKAKSARERQREKKFSIAYTDALNRDFNKLVADLEGTASADEPTSTSAPI